MRAAFVPTFALNLSKGHTATPRPFSLSLSTATPAPRLRQAQPERWVLALRLLSAPPEPGRRCQSTPSTAHPFALSLSKGFTATPHPFSLSLSKATPAPRLRQAQPERGLFEYRH